MPRRNMLCLQKHQKDNASPILDKSCNSVNDHCNAITHKSAYGADRFCTAELGLIADSNKTALQNAMTFIGNMTLTQCCG